MAFARRKQLAPVNAQYRYDPLAFKIEPLVGLTSLNAAAHSDATALNRFAALKTINRRAAEEFWNE
jgi:hypothetical protein